MNSAAAVTASAGIGMMCSVLLEDGGQFSTHRMRVLEHARHLHEADQPTAVGCIVKTQVAAHDARGGLAYEPRARYLERDDLAGSHPLSAIYLPSVGKYCAPGAATWKQSAACEWHCGRLDPHRAERCLRPRG